MLPGRHPASSLREHGVGFSVGRVLLGNRGGLRHITTLLTVLTCSAFSTATGAHCGLSPLSPRNKAPHVPLRYAYRHGPTPVRGRLGCDLPRMVKANCHTHRPDHPSGLRADPTPYRHHSQVTTARIAGRGDSVIPHGDCRDGSVTATGVGSARPLLLPHRTRLEVHEAGRPLWGPVAPSRHDIAQGVFPPGTAGAVCS